MNDLATRFERSTDWREADIAPAFWLPPESPLAMPRQSLDEPVTAATAHTPATSPAGVATRRLMVFGATAILTALVGIGPFILLRRGGYGGGRNRGLRRLAGADLGHRLLVLHGGVAGFFVLHTGREQDDLSFAPHPPLPTTRTALLMPIYNENAEAAFGRLAALDGARPWRAWARPTPSTSSCSATPPATR